MQYSDAVLDEQLKLPNGCFVVTPLTPQSSLAPDLKRWMLGNERLSAFFDKDDQNAVKMNTMTRKRARAMVPNRTAVAAADKGPTSK